MLPGLIFFSDIIAIFKVELLRSIWNSCKKWSYIKNKIHLATLSLSRESSISPEISKSTKKLSLWQQHRTGKMFIKLESSKIEWKYQLSNFCLRGPKKPQPQWSLSRFAHVCMCQCVILGELFPRGHKSTKCDWIDYGILMVLWIFPPTTSFDVLLGGKTAGKWTRFTPVGPPSARKS